MKIAKHQCVSLKNHPGFSEAWLHGQICDDPTILGLGEVDVVQRERPQASGGRLDLLLADNEKNRRYEVEIMLGATDPSHIVRCIEYWDLERRRYPAYDHVAVLVAEEITTRFLNVLGLFAGSIPLIAIQLNALQVAEHTVLSFVRILDQRMQRQDDTADASGIAVDRQYWEEKKGNSVMQVCDRVLDLVREQGGERFNLRYAKSQVGIFPGGSYFSVVLFWPKLNFVRSTFKVSNAEAWKERLEEAGLDAIVPAEGRVRMRLTLADVESQVTLLAELCRQAALECEE